MKCWLIFILATVLLVQEGTGQANPSADFSKQRISSISFSDAELGEVLDFISSKAEETLKRPTNFIVVGEKTRTRTLTLKLNNVPLSTVLKYACDLTNNIAKVVPDGVLVGSKTDVMRAQSDWNEARVITGRGSAASQLTKIKISALELKDTPISAVIEYLQGKMEESQQGLSPTARPNFLLINNPQAPVDKIKVSLKLKNAPLSSVIRFVSATAGHEVCYRIDRGAIVFGHPDDLKSPPRPMTSASPSSYAWLKSKLITEVNVKNASFEESLQLIRHHAGANLNVVSKIKQADGKVSLVLKTTNLATLLAYICEQTNTNYQLEKSTIVFIDGKKRTPRKSSASENDSNNSKPATAVKPVFDK